MKPGIAAGIIWLGLAIGIDLAPVHAFAQQSEANSAQKTKGKICHMEQQCHWENFKKICTYVKVCR
jgi:coproporphyrinogen III oxidase